MLPIYNRLVVNKVFVKIILFLLLLSSSGLMNAQLLEDRNKLKTQEGDRGKSLFKRKVEKRKPKVTESRKKKNVIPRFSVVTPVERKKNFAPRSSGVGFITGPKDPAPSASPGFVIGKLAPIPSASPGFVTGKGAPIPSASGSFVTDRAAPARREIPNNSGGHIRVTPRYSVREHSVERLEKQPRFSQQISFEARNGRPGKRRSTGGDLGAYSVTRKAKAKDHSKNESQSIDQVYKVSVDRKKESKDKERREKISSYDGAIHVSSEKENEERAEKNNKQYASFQSGYKSVSYNKSSYPDYKHHNIERKRGKLVRKMLSGLSKFTLRLNRNKIQPDAVTTKGKKIKYDKDEGEIWAK